MGIRGLTKLITHVQATFLDLTQDIWTLAHDYLQQHQSECTKSTVEQYISALPRYDIVIDGNSFCFSVANQSSTFRYFNGDGNRLLETVDAAIKPLLSICYVICVKSESSTTEYIRVPVVRLHIGWDGGFDALKSDTIASRQSDKTQKVLYNSIVMSTREAIPVKLMSISCEMTSEALVNTIHQHNETKHTHNRQNLDNVHELLDKDDPTAGKIHPDRLTILLKYAVYQLLGSYAGCYNYFSDGDNDMNIITIARKMNAKLIIASDSDYFVSFNTIPVVFIDDLTTSTCTNPSCSACEPFLMNAPQGTVYVEGLVTNADPLHTHSKHTHHHSGQTVKHHHPTRLHCHVKWHSVNNVLNAVFDNIDRCILPALAALIGNDFVEFPTLINTMLDKMKDTNYRQQIRSYYRTLSQQPSTPKKHDGVCVDAETIEAVIQKTEKKDRQLKQCKDYSSLRSASKYNSKPHVFVQQFVIFVCGLLTSFNDSQAPLDQLSTTFIGLFNRSFLKKPRVQTHTIDFLSRLRSLSLGYNVFHGYTSTPQPPPCVPVTEPESTQPLNQVNHDVDVMVAYVDPNVESNTSRVYRADSMTNLSVALHEIAERHYTGIFTDSLAGSVNYQPPALDSFFSFNQDDTVPLYSLSPASSAFLAEPLSLAELFWLQRSECFLNPSVTTYPTLRWEQYSTEMQSLLRYQYQLAFYSNKGSELWNYPYHNFSFNRLNSSSDGRSDGRVYFHSQGAVSAPEVIMTHAVTSNSLSPVLGCICRGGVFTRPHEFYPYHYQFLPYGSYDPTVPSKHTPVLTSVMQTNIPKIRATVYPDACKFMFPRLSAVAVAVSPAELNMYLFDNAGCQGGVLGQVTLPNLWSNDNDTSSPCRVFTVSSTNTSSFGVPTIEPLQALMDSINKDQRRNTDILLACLSQSDSPHFLSVESVVDSELQVKNRPLSLSIAVFDSLLQCAVGHTLPIERQCNKLKLSFILPTSTHTHTVDNTGGICGGSVVRLLHDLLTPLLIHNTHSHTTAAFIGLDLLMRDPSKTNKADFTRLRTVLHTAQSTVLNILNMNWQAHSHMYRHSIAAMKTASVVQTAPLLAHGGFINAALANRDVNTILCQHDKATHWVIVMAMLAGLRDLYIHFNAFDCPRLQSDGSVSTITEPALLCHHGAEYTTTAQVEGNNNRVLLLLLLEVVLFNIVMHHNIQQFHKYSGSATRLYDDRGCVLLPVVQLFFQAERERRASDLNEHVSAAMPMPELHLEDQLGALAVMQHHAIVTTADVNVMLGQPLPQTALIVHGENMSTFAVWSEWRHMGVSATTVDVSGVPGTLTLFNAYQHKYIPNCYCHNNLDGRSSADLSSFEYASVSDNHTDPLLSLVAQTWSEFYHLRAILHTDENTIMLREIAGIVATQHATTKATSESKTSTSDEAGDGDGGDDKPGSLLAFNERLTTALSFRQAVGRSLGVDPSGPTISTATVAATLLTQTFFPELSQQRLNFLIKNHDSCDKQANVDTVRDNYSVICNNTPPLVSALRSPLNSDVMRFSLCLHKTLQPGAGSGMADEHWTVKHQLLREAFVRRVIDSVHRGDPVSQTDNHQRHTHMDASVPKCDSCTCRVAFIEATVADMRF